MRALKDRHNGRAAIEGAPLIIGAGHVTEQRRRARIAIQYKRHVRRGHILTRTGNQQAERVITDQVQLNGLIRLSEMFWYVYGGYPRLRNVLTCRGAFCLLLIAYWRLARASLISPIARPGLRFLGQVFEQFIMV